VRALALVALLALSGCTTVQAARCAGDARPHLRAELIFGRSIKGAATVTEFAWRRFLDEEVTPRFPDGFTVLTVAGNGAVRARRGS
jgi:Protein of unknown function (DUF3574)